MLSPMAAILSNTHTTSQYTGGVAAKL